MSLYKCLNCGFIFRQPIVKWRQRALNPGRIYAIAMEALYYPMYVCPKCGSDAIKEISEEEVR